MGGYRSGCPTVFAWTSIFSQVGLPKARNGPCPQERALREAQNALRIQLQGMVLSHPGDRQTRVCCVPHGQPPHLVLGEQGAAAVSCRLHGTPG